MTLHAQDVFPREVPSTWLDEQDRYICHICLQLVSNRRQSSHSKKYNAGGVASSVPDFAGPLPPNHAEAFLNQHEPGLPTFEDVCLLNQPTLHFVPSKSRPAFARALSSALRCVILENTEEAWLKLFMLPRCVLPSLRRKGHHDKPLPVDILCNMWSDNKLGDLWDLARNRITNHKRGACSTSINQRTKVIDQAVSLGRSGMWGKACRILQSSRMAPNNDTTWQLLKSKHPSCPTPVPPVIHTTTVSLEPDFSITYNTHVSKVRELLHRIWQDVKRDPLLNQLFPKPPRIALKKNKSLRDMLVRSKLKKETPLTYPNDTQHLDVYKHCSVPSDFPNKLRRRSTPTHNWDIDHTPN